MKVFKNLIISLLAIAFLASCAGTIDKNIGKGIGSSKFNAIAYDSNGKAKLPIKGFVERGFAYNVYKMECYDSSGTLKWEEKFHNLITDEGFNYILNTGFHAGSQETTWYIGLKGAGTAVVGDTMASHSGWSEITAYSQSMRVEWTEGAASNESMTNSTTVDFSIDGSATVAGAFLASESTKGGSTETMYSVGNFSGGSQSVVNGDTLKVTFTASFADDGV